MTRIQRTIVAAMILLQCGVVKAQTVGQNKDSKSPHHLSWEKR